MTKLEAVARAIYSVHATSRESWEDAGGDIPHSTCRDYYFSQARAAVEALRDSYDRYGDSSNFIDVIEEILNAPQQS